MFLFEQMFDTALNGIVSSGLMSGILTVLTDSARIAAVCGL